MSVATGPDNASSSATMQRAPGVTRLRRSAHFVPGANERMLQKALGTNADCLILDLEDAVAPARKDAARQTIADWLGTVNFGAKEHVVRMNTWASAWGLADLRATMRHPPDAYVVPKVSTLNELQQIDAELCRLEREHGHPERGVGLILVATETPLGALNLPTFAECPRVIALSWGAEDLAAALGSTRARSPDGGFLDVYRHCRVQTLLCAAAGGLQPLDTAFVDFKDLKTLRQECLEAAWMGYTGKITIHPEQIDIVNAAFSPSSQDIDQATRLLAAFEAAQAEGRMAFAFEGSMVDAPHLAQAQRVLARAQQINSKESS